MEQYLVGRMFNNSMFNSALDELKEIMYFKEVTDFQRKKKFKESYLRRIWNHASICDGAFL